MDDGKVALRDGLNRKQAEAWIVEHVFDDEHPAKQSSNLHAKQIEDGNGSVSDRVMEENSRRRDSADRFELDEILTRDAGDLDSKRAHEDRRQFDGDDDRG